MEDFRWSVESRKIRDNYSEPLGKVAFFKFKNKVYFHGIELESYGYPDEEYKKTARQRFEEYLIEYYECSFMS